MRRRLEAKKGPFQRFYVFANLFFVLILCNHDFSALDQRFLNFRFSR